MKKILIFAILFVTIIVSVTCSKEEVEQAETNQNTNVPELYKNEVVTPRSGFVDIIFYRNSLTTDNYLLSQNANFVRTYNLYNKTNIDSITFVSTGKGLINVGGVILKHYNTTIFFKGKTAPVRFTAFSKASSDVFTYLPTSSTQLLSAQNSSNYMTFEIQRSASVKYNYWQDKNVVLNFVKISKNGTKTDLRVLDPLSKDSNIFMLPNSH